MATLRTPTERGELPGYAETAHRLYLHVREEGGRVGAVGLHILHGIPLVDGRLVGVDVALIVADPGEEEAPGIVVVASGHLTGLVQTLQSRPARETRASVPRPQDCPPLPVAPSQCPT